MKTVGEALRDIAEAAAFCCDHCAIQHKPIRVLVIVHCEGGLDHEWEREIKSEIVNPEPHIDWFG